MDIEKVIEEYLNKGGTNENVVREILGQNDNQIVPFLVETIRKHSNLRWIPFSSLVDMKFKGKNFNFEQIKKRIIECLSFDANYYNLGTKGEIKKSVPEIDSVVDYRFETSPFQKITDANISTEELVQVMSNGDSRVLTILDMMMNDAKGFMNILSLDDLGIRGSKLYSLINDCCSENIDKFNRTIEMLRNNIFSVEQLHSNLELPVPIPFIDDSIKIEGVPDYGQEFDMFHEKWKKFCLVQKEAFATKLETALKSKKK